MESRHEPASDDHCGIVAHKRLEKEIATLKSQKEAYIIRTSLTNSKLQDTLDTLDALSVSAAHELIQEQRASEILRRKLSQSIKYARDMERERDELREVVEDLVHKVELCDTFAAWPRGQLHLSQYIEPLPPDRPHTGRQTYHSKDLRQSVFVISTLKDDLRRERHRAEAAEREVMQLQAKLARREAELENCIIHTGHSLSPLNSNASPFKTIPIGRAQNVINITNEAKVLASSLTKEDIERLSEIAISRNRSLELEVRAANERLENIRSEEHIQKKPGTGRNTVRTGIRDRVPHATRCSRQSGTFMSPHLAQQNDRSLPSYTHSYPDQAPAPSIVHTMPTSGKHETPPYTNITILTVQQQMEGQLQRLSSAIDHLASERRLVREFLDERAQGLTEDMDDPTVVNRPDSPGDVRRGRSVSVRPITGCQSTRRSAWPSGEQRKEKGSCSQAEGSNIIDLLDDDEKPPPTPFPILPTPTEHRGRTNVDHDDDGTEKSMELSTPLQSTVILGEVNLEAGHRGDQVDHQVGEKSQQPSHDTPVEPGPAHNGSEPIVHSCQTPMVEGTEQSPREDMERRIEQLEGELRAARQELSATDESLRQLREFIEIVQLEMDNGDPLPEDDIAS